jgi:hypothetical protein
MTEQLKQLAKKGLDLHEMTEWEFSRAVMFGAQAGEFRGPSDVFTTEELITIHNSASFVRWGLSSKMWLMGAFDLVGAQD